MEAGLSTTAQASGHAHRTLRAPRHPLTLLTRQAGPRGSADRCHRSRRATGQPRRIAAREALKKWGLALKKRERRRGSARGAEEGELPTIGGGWRRRSGTRPC